MPIASRARQLFRPLAAPLLVLGAACEPSTAPNSDIGTARVLVENAFPRARIPVRVTRSTEGTWYASACAVHIQHLWNGQWQEPLAQPEQCDGPWLPFGPGQDAEFEVEMPYNSTDGVHRLVLHVLPYDGLLIPLANVAPIEPVVLYTNGFMGLAIR